MDSSNDEEIHFNLLFLPTEILEKILSFLSYDEISYSRLVGFFADTHNYTRNIQAHTYRETQTHSQGD